MSPKNAAVLPNAAQNPKTVDEAVGPLTEQAVNDATEGLTKKTLGEARGIAVGLATLLLDSTDPQDKAVVELLGEVNIGMRDVLQLASLAMALLSAQADRDRAEAEARATNARFEAMRTKLHDASTSFANLARGKLGAKSPALEKFGIKTIGGRKGAKRVSKKSGDNKDSGSGQNGSGNPPKV